MEGLPKKEKITVLLMALYASPSEEMQTDESVKELGALAETALEEDAQEIRVLSVSQCRPTPDAAYYFGKGKAKEMAELCRAQSVTLAVADAELSPSQIRNLEDVFNEDGDENSEPVRVIDRTMLILDIFAAHALTGEGKMQVEIAQLKYSAPRLTGKGIALSRQGGTSGAVGARGPGETKLETDKRHIQRRILALKEELAEMEKERGVKRAKRMKSGIPTAAIVGYTNAGKSTLLNYLTGAGVLSENKLFATLDTTARKLRLPSGKEMVLTDTVGFINKLPHSLVEAFHSTLEEVKYADVLLVVADASDENAEEKTQVTEELLADLGCEDKPRLYVYNKCDLLADADAILPEKEDSVCLSALDGRNTARLLEKVEELLSKTRKTVTFLFPFSDPACAGAVSYLYKNAVVNEVSYTDDGTVVTAVVTEKEVGLYGKYAETEEKSKK